MAFAVIVCSSRQGTAPNDTKYARVVELVDSLDSGSSAHSGRGGSTPPSRTIRDRRKPVSFFVSRALTERLKTPGFHAFSGIQGIFCAC